MGRSRMAALMTLAALAAACPGGRVGAEPLYYSETATGSGSLGSQSFTDALIEVTASGDSALVHASLLGSLTLTTGTVSVEYVGEGAFTDVVSVVTNFATGVAVMGDFPQSGEILADRNDAFYAYDLTTPIGPTVGAASFNPGIGFKTSAGLFVLNSVSSPVTFTASTSPPAPLPLTPPPPPRRCPSPRP